MKIKKFKEEQIMEEKTVEPILAGEEFYTNKYFIDTIESSLNIPPLIHNNLINVNTTTTTTITPSNIESSEFIADKIAILEEYYPLIQAFLLSRNQEKTKINEKLDKISEEFIFKQICNFIKDLDIGDVLFLSHFVHNEDCRLKRILDEPVIFEISLNLYNFHKLMNHAFGHYVITNFACKRNILNINYISDHYIVYSFLSKNFIAQF